MSKPKIKQILNESEVDLTDKDAFAFYIQYESDMDQIMLTIKANRSITPEEYFDALVDFIDSVHENPSQIFVDDPSHEENSSLH